MEIIQKIKQLNSGKDKLEFILNSIYSGHKNLSVIMNLHKHLNPLKNEEIDDFMEGLINDLLGYYVFVEKNKLDENEFVKTALQDLFVYMKKNKDLKFKSKRFSNYLKII
jgi:hypothetical protein